MGGPRSVPSRARAALPLPGGEESAARAAAVGRAGGEGGAFPGAGGEWGAGEDGALCGGRGRLCEGLGPGSVEADAVTAREEFRGAGWGGELQRGGEERGAWAGGGGDAGPFPGSERAVVGCPLFLGVQRGLLLGAAA